MPLKDCRLLPFPRVTDHRGDLVFLEGAEHVPFPIARIYYLFGAPAGAKRGGHANRTAQHVIVAVAGQFDVELDDGRERRAFTLRNPDEGLLVPALVWRLVSRFSPGAVCLCVSSGRYLPEDVIRDRAEFERTLLGSPRA